MPSPTHPLAGAVVLVTRPGAAGQSLCKTIADRNGHPVSLPTIVIEAVEPDPAAACPADAAIFVSRPAVDFGLAFVHRQRQRLPAAVFAVGQATAAALAAHGIDAVAPPADASNSEGLLALPGLQRDRIRHKRILIFRGRGGREHLAEGLKRRGAEVHYLEVYRRAPLPADIEAAVAAAGGKRPEVIVATSVEVLTALADAIRAQGQSWLYALPLVTLSQRVAAEAAALGFAGRVWVTRDASDAAILEALADWAADRRGAGR